MSDPTSGTTNVVIGAASGMGAATATLLAPRGRLLLADRDLAPLEEVAARIRGEVGGAVETMSCDVTDWGQVEAVARPPGRSAHWCTRPASRPPWRRADPSTR